MRIIKKIYIFLLMFFIIVITGCYNNKKTNEGIEVNGIIYELNSDNNACFSSACGKLISTSNLVAMSENLRLD